MPADGFDLAASLYYNENMPNQAKQLIKDSFIKLLSEKPLSQITVTDIVNESGINRNSFYYHFQDLPGLIESIVFDEMEVLFAKYNTLNSLDECLGAVIEFALSNRRLALHLFNSNNRDIFDQYLMQITDHVIRKYMDVLCSDKNIDPSDREILITFYKSLMFGLIVDWMSSGMDPHIRENFTRLTEIYSGIPEEIVRRVST